MMERSWGEAWVWVWGASVESNTFLMKKEREGAMKKKKELDRPDPHAL